jgi:ubiquinone/menaquinone biosynthesis C-methylase UbiE
LMSLAKERLKERISKEWNAPALVAAYRKWDKEESAWGREATEVIVQRANLEPGMTVLDLASGHGEPSLALAQAVGPEGHVTATDTASGLLTIAKAKANRMRLRNMTFRRADGHDLPFPDCTFDRVTCKWGVMYFADCQQALQESLRVLKPGGRATFLAWGRSQKQAQPQLSEPTISSPFTFSEPGSLTTALGEAGYTSVEEEQMAIALVFPGTPERCWEWFVEMSAPFEPANPVSKGAVRIEDVEQEQRKRALGQVRVGFEKSYDGKQVTLPGVIVVASGSR